LQPCISYLICCAERTGSTLLGNALIDTGVAGRPRSYFNRVAHFNPRMQRILGNAGGGESYLDKVIKAATTLNGVFGAKVHWQHFLNLIAMLEPGLLPDPITAAAIDRLRMHFPDLRFIWLVRRNAVARAISHYRVKKTNEWQLDSRWITNDTGGEGEPGFDFDEINAFLRAGKIEDEHWRRFFWEHDIRPLDLVYEDLIQDPAGTVRRVMEFLGLPASSVTLPPPNLRRQADCRSQDWEARYRRIAAEEGS
jgi:trehalose 2-sulfotransferase